MLRAAQYFHHRGTVRPGAIAFGVRSIRVSRHGQTLNRQDAKMPRRQESRGSGRDRVAQRIGLQVWAIRALVCWRFVLLPNPFVRQYVGLWPTPTQRPVKEIPKVIPLWHVLAALKSTSSGDNIMPHREPNDAHDPRA
jgi:hypothetical protein